MVAFKSLLLYSRHKRQQWCSAVDVDVDYSSKADFDEHAAVTESVAVQTVIETGILVPEGTARLWIS